MASTSPETVLLGFTIAQATSFYLAGTFGGFMPMIVDFIQREAQKAEQRTSLDKTFWIIKGVILPLCALIITAFAVSSDNVTTWLAALYLGASFPILAQRIVSLKPELLKTPDGV